MIRRPPSSTRTDTLFPYTTLFRAADASGISRSLLSASRVTGRPFPPPSANHRYANWTIIAQSSKAQATMTRPSNSGSHLYGLSASRSEEHTSELQSLMRSTYAGFCLKQKKHEKTQEKRNKTQ